MESTIKYTPRKNIKKSSPPVPIISLRTEEEKLLTYMNKSESFKRRFNINNYSDMFKIPRSTTRSRLKKLDRIGLIYYKPNERIGEAKIKKTGEIYLENIALLRKRNPRIGERKKAKKNELSTHWHKFSYEIINKDKFRKERLNFLDCSWKENKGMKNWNEVIVTFDDATITIKPKTLVLELKDIVEKNVSEVDSKCLRRMIEYSELLNSLGIELGETTIERGHWARVDSLLADIIYKKIGNKYYLLDENGKKIFWIDFSKDETGKRKKEDEVPDKLARENLDHNIDQQLNSKFDFNKIDSNAKEITNHDQIIGHALKTLGQYDRQIALHLRVEKKQEKHLGNQTIHLREQTEIFKEIRDLLKNVNK